MGCYTFPTPCVKLIFFCLGGLMSMVFEVHFVPRGLNRDH